MNSGNLRVLGLFLCQNRRRKVMKKYIAICEKSSIMENLAEALPEKLVKRGRNYYGEHYQIHALSGHIFELFNMEDYPEYPSKKKGWDLDALPFFPKTFRYKLMQKTTGGTSAKKIFDDIVKGIEWADAVIHVGDSDDEGQVLVDNVLHYAKCTKPVYRLIQDSNTVDEFKEALQKMKPNNSPEYKAMALEGRFRAFYDWLYGINASRYASLKFGTTGKDCYHVGRVITAIVFEIFKRDYEIQNFVPQPYFQNVSKEGLTLTSKTTFKTEEEASKVADQYNRAGAKVIAMNRRKTVIQAPKLFSQNTLQGWMGKYYKMSPSDTLKTVQSLYENGYASYPRTESEYLKSEEKNKIKKIIQSLQGSGVDLAFKDSNKIFNDKKVIAHSALVPTGKIPDMNKLNQKEQIVYKEIVDRFHKVFFSEECMVHRTTLDIQCLNEKFRIQGDIYISKGWKQVKNLRTNDREIPDFQKGDNIPINFQPEKKMTTPPKHYTTDTLVKFMDNPFAKDEEIEDEDTMYANIRKGATIGKTSTRAEIINKAQKSGYISLKKDIYRIEQKGIFYINSLFKLGIDLSKESTVKMGVLQREVGTGQISIKKALQLIYEDVNHMFEKRDQNFLPVICRCPICRGRVLESVSGFQCENNDLIMMKDHPYFAAVKKKVDRNMVAELFTQGSVDLLNCKSQKGKSFNVKVMLEEAEDGSIVTNHGYVRITTEFLKEGIIR